MLTKTRAIVLNQIPYSDSSNIVNLYTEQFGRITCFVRRNKGRSKASNINLLQPFFLLEIIVYVKENKTIHNIRDLGIDYPLNSIPFHPVKRNIAIFLSEVLHNSIKEVERNADLYVFLSDFIKEFDAITDSFSYIHIKFLLQLSKYLGIFPINNFSEENNHFDFREGRFNKNNFGGIENETAAKIWWKALCFVENSSIEFSISERSYILEALIKYYQMHLEGMPRVKSLEIFQAMAGR